MGVIRAGDFGGGFGEEPVRVRDLEAAAREAARESALGAADEGTQEDAREGARAAGLATGEEGQLAETSQRKVDPKVWEQRKH